MTPLRIIIELAGGALMVTAAYLIYPPAALGLGGFLLWAEANNVFKRD